MRLIVILVSVGLLEAKPSAVGFFPNFSFSGVIGGSDAAQGEFPWQLSQQRLGASWSHSCGASLLANTKVLSAAHCVDGANSNILRVVAGQHKLSDATGTQISNVRTYVMHEQYNNGEASYANDIAILHLSSAITTGTRIQFASLPANDNNNFAGSTCVISGWGRTSTANEMSDTLQKASMQIQTTAQCRADMTGVSGVIVWDKHICLQDSNGSIGSCNGDSGGPLNCQSGGTTVVAGVTSWGISNILRQCLPAYPSVYTRTSSYLAWINAN